MEVACFQRTCYIFEELYKQEFPTNTILTTVVSKLLYANYILYLDLFAGVSKMASLLHAELTVLLLTLRQISHFVFPNKKV